MNRPREQIIGSLEGLYREGYQRAQAAGDPAEMARLDFEFRRDQLYLEAILDVRDRLAPATPSSSAPQQQKEEKSVLEQINDLRSLTRFPFGR